MPMLDDEEDGSLTIEFESNIDDDGGFEIITQEVH